MNREQVVAKQIRSNLIYRLWTVTEIVRPARIRPREALSRQIQLKINGISSKLDRKWIWQRVLLARLWFVPSVLFTTVGRYTKGRQTENLEQTAHTATACLTVSTKTERIFFCLKLYVNDAIYNLTIWHNIWNNNGYCRNSASFFVFLSLSHISIHCCTQ